VKLKFQRIPNQYFFSFFYSPPSILKEETEQDNALAGVQNVLPECYNVSNSTGRYEE
jgi:hypothetical protein